jgi:hypothetical protein
MVTVIFSGISAVLTKVSKTNLKCFKEIINLLSLISMLKYSVNRVLKTNA